MRLIYMCLLFAFNLASNATAQAFYVPLTPPRAHYVIQVDIDAVRGKAMGKERIRLTNTSKRAIEELIVGGIGIESSSKIFAAEIPVNVIEHRTDSGEEKTRFRLPKPLAPGATVELRTDFQRDFKLKEDGTITWSVWYPKLWWGVPTHDDYEVKFKVPDEFAIGTSGRWDEESASWRASNVRQFGVFIGKGMKADESNAGETRVRVIHSATSNEWARTLLTTAVDAIEFYRQRFGMYPHDSLTIVPGMPYPVGGYPMATSLVVVHGMEAYSKRSETFWRWITAHEIGHQYWFEHVMSRDYPDNIGWLLIGLGVYADSEYCKARGMSGPHKGMLEGYIDGARRGLDTTALRTNEDIDATDWDFNNVVTHGKGFAIVSALAATLGEATFERLYLRVMLEFGGKRLATADFERFAEEQSGQDLTWFFDQWVRSNRFLAYAVKEKNCAKLADSYDCQVTVEKLGTMEMPLALTAKFEDDTVQTKMTDWVAGISEVRFRARSPLKDALLDVRGELAQVIPPPEVTSVGFRRELQALPWTGVGQRAHEMYQKAQKLPPPSSPVNWKKLGLVLYDASFYEEAMASFQHLSESSDEGDRFAGLVWQGHILDLVGKRADAVEKYREALALKASPEMMHSQYGITVNRKWVESRLVSPFVRVEK